VSKKILNVGMMLAASLAVADVKQAGETDCHDNPVPMVWQQIIYWEKPVRLNSEDKSNDKTHRLSYTKERATGTSRYYVTVECLWGEVASLVVTNRSTETITNEIKRTQTDFEWTQDKMDQFTRSLCIEGQDMSKEILTLLPRNIAVPSPPFRILSDTSSSLTLPNKCSRGSLKKQFADVTLTEVFIPKAADAEKVTVIFREEMIPLKHVYQFAFTLDDVAQPNPQAEFR